MLSQISRALLIGTLISICFCALTLIGPWALLILVPFAVKMQRNRRQLSAMGTAKWATESDLDLRAKGLAIGRLAVPRRSIIALFNPRIPAADACDAFFGKRQNPLICLPNVVHTTGFAGTGVGKTSSLVMDHALRCPDSTVFMDFNAEIATVAAEYRRTHFANRIILLDPFHLVTNNPDTFSPVDSISAADPLAIDDIRTIGEALVIRSGHEHELHWNDGAEMFIAGITAFVVQHAPPHDRSLQTVREILANREELVAAVTVMQQSQAWNGMLRAWGIPSPISKIASLRAF